MNSATTSKMDAMVAATAKKLGLRKLTADQVRFIRDDATAAVDAAMSMRQDASKYVLQAMAAQTELARRAA